MRILKATKFKQCRDGTVINEIHLDDHVALPLLNYLADFGELRIFENMDPPFYSFTIPGCFTMKGMVTEKSIHVKFKKEVMEQGRELFQVILAQYREGSDTRMIRAYIQQIQEGHP